MMKNARHPRTFGRNRRTRIILIAIISLLVPVMLLLQSSRAQIASHTGSSKTATSRLSSASGFGLASVINSAKQRQGPQPISSQAVGFGETRPLAEIAREQPAAPSREDREGEDREAAENPVIKHVSPQALADASREGGVVKDGALQTSIPEPKVMPTPNLTFEGLGRTENINAGFGSLSPPDTNGDVGPN